MALSNVLLLSQIAGNVVAWILSLCVVVPLAMHQHEFRGHCLLFTNGEWQEEDGYFNAQWASLSYCHFPLATSILGFLLSSIQIARQIRQAVKEETPSFFNLFLNVFFGILICAMTLIAAIMITVGFIVWCSNMTQRFPSCELAAGQNITKEQINTSRFYDEMGTAQFGAWGSFAIWVGLCVFALLKLINEHQMQNMKASMYLERHKLVNEDDDEGPSHLTATTAASAAGTTTPPAESIDALNDANII